MSSAKLGLLALVLIFSFSCRNGAVKSVCVETDTQPYESCHYENTSTCEEWDTSCSVDAFGEETCRTVCVAHHQVERCETRYREVCTAYENRYYCKALKEWMTWNDFNTSCPAPANKRNTLTEILAGNQFANMQKQCVINNNHNDKMLEKASKKINLSRKEIVSIIESHSIAVEQMDKIKSMLNVVDSKDAFSVIQQAAESNLEFEACQK